MTFISPDAASSVQRIRELEIENRHLKSRLAALAFLGSRDQQQDKEPAETEHAASFTAEYAFDSERDTLLAHKDVSFASTLHIFHMEYFGIRAAAGNLPGAKLAVRAGKPLSPHAIANIIDTVQRKGYNRLVWHGYSANMDTLARRVGAFNGLESYCVWHGNFAQLAYKDERAAFQRWLKLQKDGLVTRAHILKQNSSQFLTNGFIPLLLNLPPKWNHKRISAPFSIKDATTAFLPSWSDVRKNWHANLLAAANTPAVKRILYYAETTPLFSLEKPTDSIKFDVKTHLEIVSSVDIIFNATLIDCHPMVDLEAVACGTPSVTARLFLDELENHPYARLTEVDNPLDVDAVARVASNVAEVPPTELLGLMNDYSLNITRIGLSRYRDFLRL
ncbi:hypothetical protein HGP17_27880 [Rhizobium sp. P38BS-XIX]|uniref:hypothetical protein n=1 Tax=Rhizobium sp. P38BS-XIX TaxID=2726740 RepID=UPI001457967E|nr:hypothetical protein [Rhizobium sp. P38BS-XIX]NLS00666.1 hypothetical protein [Rhizobium sp. P38BS-XIX]